MPVSASPFRGAVNIRFLDTILASTDAGYALTGVPGESVLIPFADIYFEYLERTGEMREDDTLGMLGGWRVSAGGRAANDVMWSIDEPSEAYRAFRQYGLFDSRILSVELNPEDPSRVDTPSL